MLLISAVSLGAQINTYSPYSRYGVGDLRKPGFGQNLSMGFSGIGYRSSRAINYLNPASYSSLDTMSFIFDFGLNTRLTKYETEDMSGNLWNSNIHHIGIAFPFTRWWKAAVGISPYSSVGYNIVDKQSDPDIGLLDYYFEGNGGLNNFFLGTSISLIDHFSIGLNYSYYFGYLNNNQRVIFPVGENYARTYVMDTTLIRDGVLDFGFQYHDIFADKYFLNLGATYNAKTSLKSNQTTVIQNYFPGSSAEVGDTLVLSPVFVLDRSEKEGEFIYPQGYGIGVSFGILNKLNIMGDYYIQNWGESSVMGINDYLVNSSTMKFGTEFIPDYQALRGYYNRIHYRLGGYFSNTYLSIRGEQLQDYGITFGVGLPFKGTKTTFNLGMVLGQRGTLKNNLIKENYGIINVSFTLYDFWFLKRKFD